MCKLEIKNMMDIYGPDFMLTKCNNLKKKEKKNQQQQFNMQNYRFNLQTEKNAKSFRDDSHGVRSIPIQP